MKTYTLSSLSAAEIQTLTKRPGIDFDQVVPIVQNIINEVRTRGDAAVLEYELKFDKAELTSLSISEDEITAAASQVSPEVKTAIAQAVANIEKYQSSQLTSAQATVETMPGVTCWSEARAISSVGIYIPGGTAPLVSTVLMLAIPARLAGCQQVVLCSPPDSEGNISPEILYAASQCGIAQMFKVGGAQAIATLAYGTQSIPKVDKVFGPGNQYVTAAKMLVSTDPAGAAIDMPAGPSEVLVIADVDARADFVAADLLSQAEHGPDSQVVLVTTSEDKAKQVADEVNKQLSTLPRQDVARQALANSLTLLTDTLDEAIEFANQYAPEHLILNVTEFDTLVSKVQNAGSVFLGQYASESAGDYASGTNHVLPTYGYARTYSGVGVSSFQKSISFQELTKNGARLLASTVTTLAAVEQLEAHRRAMQIRIDS